MPLHHFLDLPWGPLWEVSWRPHLAGAGSSDFSHYTRRYRQLSLSFLFQRPMVPSFYENEPTSSPDSLGKST
jgi:hypothetical protein